VLVANSSPSAKIDENLLARALAQIDESEWRKNKSYVDDLRDRRSERRDYQMLNVWNIRNGDKISAAQRAALNDSKWLVKAADSLKDIKIQGIDLVPSPPGGVAISVATERRSTKTQTKKRKRNRR
jgi:hypothetical protein